MNRFLSVTTIILSVIAISFSLFQFSNRKQIFYVENGKLYDGFTLKKEYENHIQKLRIGKRNMLDSIGLKIRQLEASKMTKEAEYAQEFYVQKAKIFEEEEEAVLTEYNQQIWKRLNQYAIEYSKEKNIDILFGASGNGTILHANEILDVTNDLIVYANKRYSGK
jgi:outer membrane protein